MPGCHPGQCQSAQSLWNLLDGCGERRGAWTTSSAHSSVGVAHHPSPTVEDWDGVVHQYTLNFFLKTSPTAVNPLVL